MVEPVSRSFEFDGVSIDVGNRRLIREGEIIRITPKAFDLLLLLVERHGRVLQREVIMESLWPGTSVEESNLTQTVYMLRRALGERPDGESYIETVPKIGYRFTREVQVAPAARESLVAVHPVDSSDRVDWADSVNEVDSVSKPERADRVDAIDRVDLVEVTRTDAIVEEAVPVRSLMNSRRRRRSKAVLARVFATVLGLVCLGLVIFLSLRARNTGGDSGINSIAILPLKPIHIEPRDEYLGLGVADALITRLSNLRNIVIRPTDAIRRYDGVERDPLDIARELAVDGVLTGSVQRMGSRLRVTLQLLKVKDGAALWAGQFDEKFTDVFALEDSMSRQITGALAVKLSGEESKRLAAHGTNNAAAFDLYLKGRYYWGQNTPASVQQGLECFQQAVSLDPSYALAYVGIADSYAMAASGLRPAERFPLAREAANRAILLDDALAEAHASIGYILYKFYWEWSTAEREFKRAIELRPNGSIAHHYYGEYLCLTGRFDEGFEELGRANELEPLSTTIRADIGVALYRARRYAEAIEQLKSTIGQDPTSWIAHFYLALAYEARAMYDEAVAEALSSRKLSGQFEDSVPSLKNAYARGGWKAFLEQYLAVMREHSVNGYVPPYWISVLYVRLGDKERALEWLSRSVAQRDDGPLALKVDPTYDPLRSDVRFQELVHQVGLAQ
jgi:DNA-binding winged helix-turn-helix (wHTH) protein/TolB-like protein/tetratricopeptide (TPR) repeat protein